MVRGFESLIFCKYFKSYGSMAEWSNAPASKTGSLGNQAREFESLYFLQCSKCLKQESRGKTRASYTPVLRFKSSVFQTSISGSSRGQGRGTFTPQTRVRIPYLIPVSEYKVDRWGSGLTHLTVNQAPRASFVQIEFDPLCTLRCH